MDQWVVLKSNIKIYIKTAPLKNIKIYIKTDVLM